jgi:hypothetical protein
MHEENERSETTKLLSTIMTSVLEEAPESATPDEIFGLIAGHYAKRNKPGQKFLGKCYDCKQTGHRKGDPQCPGPLTPQQLSKSSSSSDETGSIPSVQSVSSASGPNPTYVINIPKDYAGSPLFFPSPATPPIVGASAQFSSPFPDTPISHHTFQQNWNPPLPPGNTPAQTNFCDYRSFIANAQRPSKPSVSLGRGLIGMDFAKTSP